MISRCWRGVRGIIGSQVLCVLQKYGCVTISLIWMWPSTAFRLCRQKGSSKVVSGKKRVLPSLWTADGVIRYRTTDGCKPATILHVPTVLTCYCFGLLHPTLWWCKVIHSITAQIEMEYPNAFIVISIHTFKQFVKCHTGENFKTWTTWSSHI